MGTSIFFAALRVSVAEETSWNGSEMIGRERFLRGRDGDAPDLRGMGDSLSMSPVEPRRVAKPREAWRTVR
jgi:hypothetical protein